MIGQDFLVTKVNTLTLDTFPRSLLLLGPSGCGKHSFIHEYIVSKLQLPVFDISENITLDIINEIYTKVEPYIYLVDLRKLNIKQENVILKLLEEPLKNAFLILVEENKNNILPTIINRCQVWEFKPYTRELLRTFLKDDNTTLLDICTTPGQILQLQQQGSSVDEMIDFCNKIITSIGSANSSNILNISNRLAYKNEVDKWNYDVFCSFLFNQVKQQNLITPSRKNLNLFIATKTLVNDNNISHINKQHLFENYLYKIKNIMQ